MATAVALVVAACGGDSSPGASSGADTTAAPATTTAPTTVPPTTLAPTTVPPTTVAPTTAPPSGDGPLVGPDGRPRTWELHVPEGLDPGAPLVVALHGAGGSGAGFRASSGYDELADAEGFAVVFPDAIGVLPTWDAGGCCPPASLTRPDDVGFVVALVDRLVAELASDPDRVYVTGHSNGAMLTHRLACETDRFAAAVAVAGSLEWPCADPPAVSMLQIHGTADRIVPYDDRVEGVLGIEFTPAPVSIERWSTLLGCDPDPVIEIDGAVTTSTSTGCRDDVTVELRSIEGGDHSWPRGAAPIDATVAGWAFLAAHAG